MTTVASRSDPAPTDDRDTAPVTRLVDRFDPRLVNAFTVLGFGLPVCAYLWLVAHYSVNTVVSDQWDDVTVIRASYAHLFPWGVLWAPHNESRVFFPNLIVILLARTTHFNIRFEEFLSAGMLLAAIALLIWAHKRRSPTTPWLYYCPVAFLALTFAQWQNALWGFQMAWYVVLLTLAVTIVLLDRPVLGRLAFAGAVLVAVIGSYSLIQGFIFWPVGLLLLYHRRRPWPLLVIWAAVGLAAMLFYLHDFHHRLGGPYPGYASQHPLVSLRFFLVTLGDILGLKITAYHQGAARVAMFFGVVVLVLAIATLLAYGIKRDEHSAAPIGIALTCTGLLFALMVTRGRVVFGYPEAASSRYTTFDLLVPLGVYLTVLARKPLGRRSGDSLQAAESRTLRARYRYARWSGRCPPGGTGTSSASSG